jgi:menaquinone-dependent protoporphyrinogen oxidase
MNNRILVAYATRAGSTIDAAETVGRVLRDGGAAVDVRPVGAVADLADYDALVVGSAVRAAEALRLLERHAPGLGDRPVAYFVVCGTLKDDTPENRRTVDAYLDPLRRIKEPAAVGLFAGKIDHRTLNPLIRLLLKLMKAPEGDWRDWERIRSWAAELLPRLGRPAPAATALT